MKKVLFFVLAGFILGVTGAQADMGQIKAYKAAYPDARFKCLNCHVDKMPKKDGAHELNAYGKAVIKAAGAKTPTADTYKTVGKVEDFKS